MPTYEYECTKCQMGFEAFQSMKDNHFEVCPEEKCRMKEWGQGKVKRLLGTGAGLIFKGSGFYITDYRSEGYKSAEKKDSSAASEAKKPDSAASSSTAAPAVPSTPAPAPSKAAEAPKSGSKSTKE